MNPKHCHSSPDRYREVEHWTENPGVPGSPDGYRDQVASQSKIVNPYKSITCRGFLLLG